MCLTCECHELTYVRVALPTKATTYFNMVCLQDCDTGYKTLANATDVRVFEYKPARDFPVSSCMGGSGVGYLDKELPPHL